MGKDKEKEAPTEAPKPKFDNHPTTEPGAVMRDKDGNEVFVPCGSQFHAVRDRLKLGWTMLDDRRPVGHPSHPEYKAAT